MQTLHQETEKLIEQYLGLPYFNNKTERSRGALRVLIGKGLPKEIIEEAEIMAMKEKIDFSKLDEEQKKKFLVDHHLGIDCSGLAFHILNTEFKNQYGKNLARTLKRNRTGSFLNNALHKLIAMFRPAENTDVKVFADNRNSKIIHLEEVSAGDIVTMLGQTPKSLNHILIVKKVQKNQADGLIDIDYVHAIAWGKDGRYDHGVRQGKIIVGAKEENILSGKWIERDLSDTQNETYERARSSVTEVRRVSYL